MIEIPPDRKLDIKHIVCDYNGTIAKDGIVKPEVAQLFQRLSENYMLHVITADTFGSVTQQLEQSPVNIHILSSHDHTREKADYILSLGLQQCAVLGNGNNDTLMLQTAALGIAIMGEEGCARETFLAADLLFGDISEALSLFIHPGRLIATLRK